MKQGLWTQLGIFFSIVMLCRELVYKSAGTRWKCRNSSSAGVNEHNSTNWSAGKPGPWFLDGLTGFAVFWGYLAGALKEQVAQAVTRLCMWVACAASFPPMQQMLHTCTALSWPLGPGGLLRRKNWFPRPTGLCCHEYFGDTCCWD